MPPEPDEKTLRARRRSRWAVVAIVIGLASGVTALAWPSIELRWYTSRLLQVGGDPVVAERAMRRLLRMGPRGAAALAEGVRRKILTGTNRRDVLSALVDMRAPGVSDLLLGELQDPAGSAELVDQIAAAKALGRLGDVRAVGPLFDFASGVPKRERPEAARAAFAAVGDIGPGALGAAIAAAEQTCAFRGAECIPILRGLAPVLDRIGAPAVVPLLKSNVAWLLGGMTSTAVVRALQKALGDDDDGLRAAAVRAFGELRTSEAISVLLGGLGGADGNATADALAQIGAPSVPALTGALASADAGVRLRAVRALGRIGAPEALAALGGLAAEQDPEVREARARARESLTSDTARRSAEQLATMLSTRAAGPAAPAVPADAPGAWISLSDDGGIVLKNGLFLGVAQTGEGAPEEGEPGLGFFRLQTWIWTGESKSDDLAEVAGDTAALEVPSFGRLVQGVFGAAPRVRVIPWLPRAAALEVSAIGPIVIEAWTRAFGAQSKPRLAMALHGNCVRALAVVEGVGYRLLVGRISGEILDATRARVSLRVRLGQSPESRGPVAFVRRSLANREPPDSVGSRLAACGALLFAEPPAGGRVIDRASVHVVVTLDRSAGELVPVARVAGSAAFPAKLGKCIEAAIDAWKPDDRTKDAIEERTTAELLFDYQAD